MPYTGNTYTLLEKTPEIKINAVYVKIKGLHALFSRGHTSMVSKSKYIGRLSMNTSQTLNSVLHCDRSGGPRKMQITV